MPTIDQLAPATACCDDDEMLVSQDGISRKVTRTQLLAGYQTQLAVTSGKLLGRNSAGTGVPEQITVGTNLNLSNGTLSANASPFVIASLMSGSVPAGGDLVPVGQSSANVTVTYGQFMSGLGNVPNLDASRMTIEPTGGGTPTTLADFAASVLPLTGGRLNGALTLVADPATPLQAATKQYVDASAAYALPYAGGTLSGALNLAADPTSAMQASTKQYVDGEVAAALPKAGGTMSGALTLAASPVSSMQAATKQYVDSTTLPLGVFSSGSFDFNAQPATTHLTSIADNGGISYANGPTAIPKGAVLGLLQATGSWLTQIFVGQGAQPTLFARGTSSGASGWSGWSPIPTGIARAPSVSALRALDISGLRSANCTAMVDGYTTPGDGGGGEFDWNAASTINDDSVVVFRPNGIASTSPGRWIRRLPAGVLTPEMAGAVGDYVFPVGSSPESGTDNTAAFQRLFNQVCFSAANGLDGATIRLAGGKKYLIAGNLTMPTGVAMEGSGFPWGGLLNSTPSIFNVGSVLVVDPAVTFAINSKTKLSWLHITRRGLNLAPTTAAVQTFWNSVATESGPSLGLHVAQGNATIEGLTIVGFQTGVLSDFGAGGTVYMRHCFLDNYNNISASGSGDTSIYENIRCVGLYGPTDGNPQNINWRRKGGVSIYIHDQADTTILKDCECEFWGVGIRLSNVWGVNMARCRVETDTINASDVCYQLQNVCSYVEFNECYGGGVVAYDIQCTDYANASSKLNIPNYAPQAASTILIRGGQVGTFAPGVGPSNGTCFRIGGNASGSITNIGINHQGQIPFIFQPTDGGKLFWKIDNIRIDEAALAEDTMAWLASIDPSAAPYVHFTNIWDANANKWIVPPNYDDSIDLLTSPQTGGTHTICDGVSWCHLTPATTLASFTMTMPPDPIDKEEMLISSTATISLLTLQPNTGQSIDMAPTSLPAHGAVRFRYLAASASWVRLIMQ
jgi:hypothetical protein